jgi:hypothetical protein
MRGRIKKKLMEETLDKLAKEKLIVAKEFGKAVIYYYNQELHPELNQDEMNKLKERLEGLKQSAKEKDAEIKELRAEIANYERIPTIEEMKKNIEGLQGQQESLGAKINKLKGTDAVLVSNEEVEKVEKKKLWSMGQMKAKQKILRDIIETVSESTEMKSDKVRDLMGLE